MTIYIDDKEAVREAIQRSSRKRAALDLIDKPPSPASGEALQTHLGRQRRLSLLDRVRELWQHRPWRPVPQPELERASYERG